MPETIIKRRGKRRPTRVRVVQARIPKQFGKESPGIGWQVAILNRNRLCDQCNAIVSSGTRARPVIGSASWYAQ